MSDAAASSKGERARVVVVGPGALGCVFAAGLTEAGHDVTVLGRDPEQAALLDAEGIELVASDGTSRRHRLRVRTEVEDAADLLLMAVKTMHTAAALSTAAPAIGADTRILTVQNGLGNVERIAALVPPDVEVLAGVTYVGGTRAAPTRIVRSDANQTIVAPREERGLPAAREAADILRSAGFAVELRPSARSTEWDKVLVNAPAGAICGLTGATLGDLVEDRDLWSSLARATREACAVARADGHDAEDAERVAYLRAVCERSREIRPSMLQDVDAGRPTEIDATLGELVRRARNHAVDAPVCAALHALMRGREQALR